MERDFLAVEDNQEVRREKIVRVESSFRRIFLLVSTSL
jgi:hypothetical protein